MSDADQDGSLAPTTPKPNSTPFVGPNCSGEGCDCVAMTLAIATSRPSARDDTSIE